MKNTLILAGAAALAFTAPVLAQPGKGNGGGGGNKGGGAPAKVERGGGGGPKQQAGGGGRQRMERGGGGQQRAERGGGQQRAERRGGQQRIERRASSGQQSRGSDRRDVRRAERQQQRADRGPARDVREARRVSRQQARGSDRGLIERRGRGSADTRIVSRDERYDTRIFRTDRNNDIFTSTAFRTTGLVNGCPPGLAAKGNGCLPPGQARKLLGAAIPATLGSALLPPLYRSWYPDSDDYYYRTQDGYVYRVDRDRNYVDAYWPVADQWNGAYYVGAAYPQDYLGYYNVPVQYQPWYADTDDSYYRYGDGAIYQVDRQGGLIESIVSLLAGGVGVGQPLPSGYDVYNVPYAYRDRYVDNDEHLYRYNDGYIYQVDPTTRLVQAIVETLV